MYPFKLCTIIIKIIIIMITMMWCRHIKRIFTICINKQTDFLAKVFWREWVWVYYLYKFGFQRVLFSIMCKCAMCLYIFIYFFYIKVCANIMLCQPHHPSVVFWLYVLFSASLFISYYYIKKGRSRCYRNTQHSLTDTNYVSKKQEADKMAKYTASIHEKKRQKDFCENLWIELRHFLAFLFSIFVPRQFCVITNVHT